jgi:hypothetical protein
MRWSYRYSLRGVAALVLLGLSALSAGRVQAQSVTASPTTGGPGGQINVTYNGAGNLQCADAPFVVLLRSGPASTMVGRGTTDSSGNAQVVVGSPPAARPGGTTVLVDFGPARSACNTAGPFTAVQAPSTPTTIPGATAAPVGTAIGTTGPAQAPVVPTGSPGVVRTLTPTPVVPEAESAILLGTGLVVLSALVAWRERRCRCR